jgi:hypothetical protein
MNIDAFPAPRPATKPARGFFCISDSAKPLSTFGSGWNPFVSRLSRSDFFLKITNTVASRHPRDAALRHVDIVAQYSKIPRVGVFPHSLDLRQLCIRVPARPSPTLPSSASIDAIRSSALQAAFHRTRSLETSLRRSGIPRFGPSLCTLLSPEKFRVARRRPIRFTSHANISAKR